MGLVPFMVRNAKAGRFYSCQGLKLNHSVDAMYFWSVPGAFIGQLKSLAEAITHTLNGLLGGGGR